MSTKALLATSGESSVRRTYLTLRTSAGRWWRLPRCAEENLPATAVVNELPSDDVSILKSRVEAPAGSPHVFVGSSPKPVTSIAAGSRTSACGAPLLTADQPLVLRWSISFASPQPNGAPLSS